MRRQTWSIEIQFQLPAAVDSRIDRVGAIAVSRPLSASASAVPTAGDAPVTVALFGSASGGTPPYAWSWDLGDGSSSTAQNPGHVYSADGTYTAILTVTDAQSHTAIAQAAVEVAPALSVTSAVSPVSGTAPLQVTFTSAPSSGKAPSRTRGDSVTG